MSSHCIQVSNRWVGWISGDSQLHLNTRPKRLKLTSLFIKWLVCAHMLALHMVLAKPGFDPQTVGYHHHSGIEPPFLKNEIKNEIKNELKMARKWLP